MIVSSPARAFVSSIAARRVQTPFPGAVSHTPSPGLASNAENPKDPSDGVLTVKIAAWAEAERKTPKSAIPRATRQALFFLSCILSNFRSSSKDLLRPHCYAGGASRYSAAVFEPNKDPIPGGIEGHVAVALNKDPEGRRRVGVDLRRHGRTNR